MTHASDHSLTLKRMGIDTHQQPVVYMRADCHVCRSEGLAAHSRVRITTDHGSIVATLNIVRDGFLEPGEAGLSDAAWRLLDAAPGQRADVAFWDITAPAELCYWMGGNRCRGTVRAGRLVAQEAE